ncbi:MAG: hypothetical protein ABFS39_15535 [Pseudomonadota bacterium]
MKYTLNTTALLLLFGIAQAGSSWDMHQPKDAANSGQTQTQQSTAIQPGIGDSANRFDDESDRRLGYEHGDWTDLRNEEIYGSF